MKTHQTFIKIKFFSFFVTCLVLALSSCKKQDVIPPGVISATIDGTEVNLNTSALAQAFFDPDVKEYNVDISGLTGTEKDKGTITIVINSYSPIAVGSYLSTIIYQPAGSDLNYGPFISDSAGPSPSTIIITSISRTNITGTFSGTLSYPAVKTITNGKFNVAVKYLN